MAGKQLYFIEIFYFIEVSVPDLPLIYRVCVSIHNLWRMYLFLKPAQHETWKKKKNKGLWHGVNKKKPRAKTWNFHNLNHILLKYSYFRYKYVLYLFQFMQNLYISNIFFFLKVVCHVRECHLCWIFSSCSLNKKWMQKIWLILHFYSLPVARNSALNSVQAIQTTKFTRRTQIGSLRIKHNRNINTKVKVYSKSAQHD